MEQTHIMLDLETLGTRPGSVILSIGACRFGNGKVYSPFYEVISIKSCIAAGLTIDPDTLAWWVNQDSKAKNVFRDQGNASSHLKTALMAFTNWCYPDNENICMWGNGAAFDNALLAEAYHRTGLVPPWKFYNDRCYRTMKNLYPDIPFTRKGTHHNALDDAISQAEHLMQILAHIKAR